ncbi:hypothetical protein DKX38_026945 [Salix brachista]|uniref:Pentatricopeptide repeat-containing protein n=1 Tax=Salix brachista TaxID=2182728 RepID=A0A5N5JML2_9ROSI|nr:hypothetical protein DKX38_026945 [Salix brachista]
MIKSLALILTTLLKVHVRGGLFEKSRDLLIELDTLGFAKKEVNEAQTDMFKCDQRYALLFIDGCLAKNGRIDEARLVFDEMKEKHVKSGEKENVMRIMRKMDEITMHRKGHQPMEYVEASKRTMDYWIFALNVFSKYFCQDNAELISQAAIKEFASSFVKLGNINLIKYVMKVILGSGYKIDEVMTIDLYEVIFVNILLVFI